MIHLEKRISIIVKLGVAALFGTVFAMVAQGKVEFHLIENVMHVLTGTTVAAVTGLLRMVWVYADSLPPLGEHLSKRDQMDVDEVVTYVQTKVFNTTILVLLTGVFLLAGYLLDTSEVYFLLQGGVLGVFIMLFAQYIDHIRTMSAFKIKLQSTIASQSRAEKILKRMDD